MVSTVDTKIWISINVVSSHAENENAKIRSFCEKENE